MTGGSETDPKPKYHGKRRNAFVGNIKYYRPPRYSEHGSQNDDNDESSSRHLHDRIRSGGVKSRLKFPARAITDKYKLGKSFDRTVRQDREGDEIMQKSEGTSSELDRKAENPYRVRNPKSNLPIQRRIQRATPIESKSYAIGEKENGFKPFLLQTQSHCKLKNIDQNVFDLIVNFLQQYFMCYDTNREGLLQAYHKNALFSLSLNTTGQASYHGIKFGSYFKESRNLVFVTGNERQYKMLHSGNLDIVAFLSKMPKTEHDSNSLKLDTCFFSPHMITFSVIGQFKEGETEQKNRPVRFFQRVFVCIPTQTGQMLIVNEQYTISNPPKEKNRGKQEIPQVQEMVSEAIPLDPILEEIQDPIRKNMILQFSKFSNLNYKWSKDCLEFSNWNYDQAASAFTSHKSDIPSDAFLS
ncbi:unnamed protein product [Brachionus calyciflorus]|uniref:Nuclear RNA export factor 1 n=1 Tax=Brachionus calyciflorus TaxID=104777 RepID=A0A814FQG0_9BILA|nr:unnamed protein product [Brachionus calyciflorus]